MCTLNLCRDAYCGVKKIFHSNCKQIHLQRIDSYRSYNYEFCRAGHVVCDGLSACPPSTIRCRATFCHFPFPFQSATHSPPFILFIPFLFFPRFSGRSAREITKGFAAFPPFLLLAITPRRSCVRHCSLALIQRIPAIK